MDIKSRSNNQNNPNSEKKINIEKTTEYTSVKPKRSIIPIILSLILISISFMFVCEGKTYRSYTEYINIPEVQEQVIRYAKNLNRFYIYFKNFDIEKAYVVLQELETRISSLSNPNSTNSINSAEYDSEYSIAYDSNEYANEYHQSYDIYNPEFPFIEEAPENFYSENSAIFNPNATREQLIIQYNNLEEKIQNYEDVKAYLDKTDSFYYSIKDNNTGETYIHNNPDISVYYQTLDINDDIFRRETFNGQTLSSSFNRNRMECQITINIHSGSELYDAIHNYENEININYRIKSITPIIVIITLLVVLYTIVKHKKSLLYYNNKVIGIYTKIPCIIKLGAAFFCLILIADASSGYQKILTSNVLYSRYSNIIFYTVVYGLMILYLYISIIYAISIIRSPKILKNEPEIKFLINSLKELKMMGKSENLLLVFLSIILILATLAAWFVLFIIFINSYIGIFELVIIGGVGLFIGLIALCFIKLISAHNKLTYYISEMSLGNLDTIPKTKGMFSNPINNLNNISDGIKLSMQKMIKNERLKTELITNVSHDLKTPLTSIISYIDLLKELRLNDAKAIEYIDVLDKKSERLKFLIDDLFEASKLSTGHTELEVETADIVALLKQTMGELSNKINESEISFKLSSPDHIYLNIDGKRMWRVFENLLNNILKYSQKGSRAYITIEDEISNVVITMKNISSYELDFDPNELFERFKRADVSRTTEGSGLGLSIARDIVELHGGTMNIIIDGDLFKVVITLNK